MGSRWQPDAKPSEWKRNEALAALGEMWHFENPLCRDVTIVKGDSGIWTCNIMSTEWTEAATLTEAEVKHKVLERLARHCMHLVGELEDRWLYPEVSKPCPMCDR